MDALLWSDYLCPWCYLGRDRTTLLEELGVAVTHLPFELHPDIPPAGRDVRAGGRLGAVHDVIAAECEAAGMPFRAPTHIPNTRRALEAAEIVRRAWPDAFAALDDALFTAHFADGLDLGDPSVLDELIGRAGAPKAAVRDAIERGDGRAYVDAAMALARDHGIAATPAWLVDGTLVIPGAQPRDVMARWVTKMLERQR